MAAVNASASVRVLFEYIKDLNIYKREKPYMVADIDYIPVHERSNIELESRGVTVEDIRGQERNFTLNQYSFEYLKVDRGFPSDDISLKSYVMTM